MKKFFLFAVAVFFTTTLHAQLVYDGNGHLTFGAVTLPSDCVTAWEGTGHYFRNSANNVSLKIDLSGKTPQLSAVGQVGIPKLQTSNLYALCRAGKAPLLKTGLSTINKLKTGTYSSGRPGIGGGNVILGQPIYVFLPDNIADILPGAVVKDADTGTQYVDHLQVVVLLTQAVQELADQVTVLESRIKQLENQ